MVEITSEEQNKVKRIKRTEDSLRDLWDNIKHTNIWIIGVPEEEEKKKGYEKVFEEIIAENFPNTEKEIADQVQEAQRVPYRINPRKNTPRHILIKLTKNKHKERILKAAREKQQVTYKGNPICSTADLSAEALQARREWQDIFKVLKGKNLQPRLLYLARISDSLRPHGLQSTRLLCPWDFPGKDTGVACHFLLQGIFPTQGSNPGLLHYRQILYRLSYKGSPLVL